MVKIKTNGTSVSRFNHTVGTLQLADRSRVQSDLEQDLKVR